MRGMETYLLPDGPIPSLLTGQGKVGGELSPWFLPDLLSKPLPYESLIRVSFYSGNFLDGLEI